jgi:hypothetical protein
MNIVRALQTEAKKLEQRLTQVRAAITALNGSVSVSGQAGRRYKRSAAARRKMSLAQRKRWAAKKAK